MWLPVELQAEIHKARKNRKTTAKPKIMQLSRLRSYDPQQD